MQNPFDSTLLILDDDKNILSSMELMFEDRVKRVLTLSDPSNLIDTIENIQPNLLIMDMNYSKGSVDGKEGLELLEKVVQLNSDLPVIVMTAYGEIDLVVRCMQLGAKDFVEKPWSNQRLLITVSNALRHEKSKTKVVKLEAENAYYKERKKDIGDFGMIGSSNAMKLLRDKISKVANSDANVLILGENGTGKELVAKAIHDQSLRSKESFIKIDLGSVHEQLFDSEMFGAKKGSYTGSQQDKIGRVVLANKGTLFLDEIGNLPLSKQAKMLSVLQNREVVQIGATKAESIDIRVVSATNMKIGELLDESKFRQDLLYRINTVEIQLPPLRERSEDIPELLFYFKEMYERKYHKTGLGIDSETLELAKNYSWPGNVRELQHAVERAVLMCSNNLISSNDLIPARKEETSAKDEFDLDLNRMEKKMIEKAMRIHSGNISKAAADLGLTRAALYRRLEKHNL